MSAEPPTQIEPELEAQPQPAALTHPYGLLYKPDPICTCCGYTGPERKAVRKWVGETSVLCVFLACLPCVCVCPGLFAASLILTACVCDPDSLNGMFH